MFGATQTQLHEEGDDMFTSIAAEIAVQNSRLLQRKEKLKCKFGTTLNLK